MPMLVSIATRGLTVVKQRTDGLLALLATCWITATEFGTGDNDTRQQGFLYSEYKLFSMHYLLLHVTEKVTVCFIQKML